MEPITLKFDLPNLSEQNITSRDRSEIVLYDTYLEAFMEFVCEELNLGLNIWEKDIKRQEQVLYKKADIDGLCIKWVDSEQIWKVVIVVNGEDALQLFFEEEIDCRVLHKKVKDWWLQ